MAIRTQSNSIANRREEEDDTARPKKALISTEQSFRRLLNFLDADETQAAVRYERLRQRLVRHSERKGCWQSDLVADRTFVRVEEILDRETPEGPLEGRDGFIVEVGKRVLSEWRDEVRRQQPPPVPVLLLHPETEDWNSQIYELCKKRLSDRDRALFDRYHRRIFEAEGKLKDVRAQIAAEEGTTIGTLRVRIHAIRKTLESYCHCCAKCLGCG